MTDRAFRASLFSVLTRYRPSPERRQGEDSLTQSLLVLLRWVPELGPRLIEAWTGWGGYPASPIARTQQRTNSHANRRIDLQIESPTDRIWIEVKHTAPLSNDRDCRRSQLQLYWDDLAACRARFTRSALVFLPPAGYQLPQHERPEEATSAGRAFFERNWQMTGRCIKEWIEAGKGSEQDRCLASEFTSFLEEEGLFVDRGFETEDREVLIAQTSASNAFADLIQRSRQEIDAWVKSQTGWQYTDSYPASPRWGDHWHTWDPDWAVHGVWIEWKFAEWDREEWRLRPGEEWAFAAGLTADDEARLRGIEAPGFTLGSDDRARLIKLLPLADVENQTPEDQLREVVAHVRDSLDEVVSALRRQTH